jgi:hypothetical protein
MNLVKIIRSGSRRPESLRRTVIKALVALKASSAFAHDCQRPCKDSVL